MRPSILLLFAVSVSTAQASWFSSNPEYASWSNKELKTWLQEHNVDIPNAYSKEELIALVGENWNSASAWTTDQYVRAQKSFADVRDTTFDLWDESRLREFLLEQGVVAPTGPRESLVILAKQKYRDYASAASSFSSAAGAAASTAVYGDSKYQLSKSASSIAAQATQEVGRVFDDSKDYIYSTWDDNMLRDFLMKKGVLKTKGEQKRDELLGMMKSAYSSLTDPIWEAWSDSYMHEWLCSHGIIDGRTDFEKQRDSAVKTGKGYTEAAKESAASAAAKASSAASAQVSKIPPREELVLKMKQYYYSSKDYAWSTWSDSDLKGWLVDHKIIKENSEINRDKLMKLVGDHYGNAEDTIWSAWSDQQIREWLVDNGHIKSSSKMKRKEMVKLINTKYTDTSARRAAYLSWPDARLRSYLRGHGISEADLPKSRSGLLQESRLRWTEPSSGVSALYTSIRDIVNGGVDIAQGRFGWVYDMLRGKSEEGKRWAAHKAGESMDWAGEKGGEGMRYAGEKGEEGARYAGDKLSDAKDAAGQQYDEKSAAGKEYAKDRVYDARKIVGEKVKVAGQKIKGEKIKGEL